MNPSSCLHKLWLYLRRLQHLYAQLALIQNTGSCSVDYMETYGHITMQK